MIWASAMIRNIVALLFLFFAVGPCSHSFVNDRGLYSFHQKFRHRTLTIRPLLNWFGSKKEDDTKQPSPSVKDSKEALGGVAGIMDNMDSFKKSQRVGKMTGALVQELSSSTVEGVSENGKVKVVLDCQQRPISTFLDEAYLEATDGSDVSTAITAAMQDAHAKSIDKMNEKMKGFFNDLGIAP